MTMQNVIANLSRTPVHVRHPGRPFGADTEAVLAARRKTQGERIASHESRHWVRIQGNFVECLQAIPGSGSSP